MRDRRVKLEVRVEMEGEVDGSRGEAGVGVKVGGK
jgi:hypothetical protein